MKRKAILTLFIIAIMAELSAGVNLTLTAGADFSHSLLYSEDIFFRTSGRFAADTELFVSENKSVSVNPYIRLSYITDSMTFNYARTKSSCGASAGVKVRIPASDSAYFKLSLGAGAGMYMTYNLASGHDDRNDSLISYGSLEAGLGIEKIISRLVFNASLGGEYRRDSIRWNLSAGFGVSL